MSRIKKFWDVHFLGLEFLLSVIMGILFFLWMNLFSGSVIVNSILNGNKGAIYGTLASVFSSLLGFVIAALAIIIGYSANEKFEFLKQSKHYATLWHVLISTIKALGLATIMMLIGLIFDRDNFPKSLPININLYNIYLSMLRSLIIFTVLLALIRMKRCIWVLDNIVKIVIGI